MNSKSEIRVEMICVCGNIAEPEYGNSSRSSSDAIVLYDHVTYICNQCGAEMKRRVVRTIKTETETETVLQTGE